MSGVCASLAIRCASPSSSSWKAVLRDVRPSPPVERCGRELYECFVFDESPQPRGSRLNLRIPFRVPKDDDEPLRAQLEQPCLEIERPAVIGELEEEAAPIACQAEAAQLVRVQEL